MNLSVPCRQSTSARRVKSCGFTLLEVLVALTILALSLAAAIRAGGAVTQTVGELRARTLAGWVAENKIALLRANNTWPNVGVSGGETAMGGETFYWQQVVSLTPNLLFRRVEVKVGTKPFADNEAGGAYLAKLVIVLLRH